MDALLVNQLGYAKIMQTVKIVFIIIQLNQMKICPKFKLDRFCSAELMLIDQIIPFMIIVSKTKRS